MTFHGSVQVEERHAGAVDETVARGQHAMVNKQPPLRGFYRDRFSSTLVDCQVFVMGLITWRCFPQKHRFGLSL